MSLKRKVFTWVDLKELVTVNINLKHAASLEKHHKLEMKVKAIFGSINVMLPTSFVANAMRTHRSSYLFF